VAVRRVPERAVSGRVGAVRGVGVVGAACGWAGSLVFFIVADVLWVLTGYYCCGFCYEATDL